MGDSHGSQSSQFSSSSSGRCKVGFVSSTLEYYSVPVSDGEFVALVRGPGTAIKVLNQHNTQVGLIEPDVSKVLAPLVDSNTITIEGWVCYACCSEAFCQVHIFACREEMSESVKIAVLQGRLLLIKLVGRSPQFLSSSDINQIEVDQRSLDAIFAVMEKKVREKAKPLALEPPKEVIKSELLEHQKVGLGWLVGQESSEDLPSFWEEKDAGYMNVLTNLVTRNPPEPLRGGIFADDMGLGKTLTLLSLIALDKLASTSVSDPGEESENSKELTKEYITASIDSAPHSERKMTLVVGPPSVLSTWISQLEEHTIPGKLKSYTYCGMEQNTSLRELQNYDIVLTTYSTLACDERRRYKSPVRMIRWWRIILNKAHLMKNSSASHTRAVMNLKAERRWAVTGTPMLDGSFDPFSFMEFLRYEPFSFKENWRHLMYRSGGLSRLKILLATISLRRTKDEDLAVLPKKTVVTCFFKLSPEERRLYRQTEAEAKNLLRSFLVTLNYNTLVSIILRLRLICISAALLKSTPSAHTIKDVSKKPKLMKKVVEALQNGEVMDCPICYYPPADMVITRCSHIFCRGCILNVIRSANSGCPLCRHRLSECDLFSAPHDSIKNEDRESAPQSSKVSTLVKLLKDSRDQNPAAQSVIFSQFRKMLILLEEPLREAGFKTLRLGGSMKKLAQVIEEFRSCKSTVILLANLELSGAGFNLTAASTVYLLDPWWNPAMEERAIGQVHRIGQTKKVRIVRMIDCRSVEERMLHLQEMKKESARMDFPGKDGSKSWQLDEYEIRMLINL